MFSIPNIRDASHIICKQVVRTPLLESPALNAKLNCRLFVKAEVLQLTGSFKYRGALNKLLSIEPQTRKHGVVAFSSGNHAQGVAYAAQRLKVPCTIVMPHDAPQIKIQNTRNFGAHVILYNRVTENRELIAQRLAVEENLTLVPPFDDFFVMAGQGTLALEMCEQLAEIPQLDSKISFGLVPDLLLCPASGGGLLAGVSTVFKSIHPGCRVMVCEPFGHDDHVRSLECGGVRQVNRATLSHPLPTTICDALMAPTPGLLTFAVNQNTVDGGYAVTDFQVGHAMRVFSNDFHLVVEPGGAVGLAAVLAGLVDVNQRVVLVVASGGNVDPFVFQKILADDVDRSI